MIKDDLLDLIKDEIQSIVDTMDYDNHCDSNALINKYFRLLELIKELPFNFSIKEEAELVYSKDLVKEDNEVSSSQGEGTYSVNNNTGTHLKEICDPKQNMFFGQLELKLQGGDIGSFKLYIPEKTVRELGCENGDWIKASKVSSKRMLDGSEKFYYQYQLVHKTEIPVETDRCVLKCVLTKLENTLNRYYVQSEYNGVPLKILLPERDVTDLQIQEGDLIDYAYWKDNILNGRVVWKHKVETDLQSLAKVINSNNKSNVDDDEDDDYELTNNITPIFKDKYIVVVGFESMKNIFREIIEKRGGKFDFFTGDEKSFNSEASLKYADAIVVFTEYVGHGGMHKVKSISKTYSIPVSYTRKLGQESFIRLVSELINSNSTLEANVLSVSS